MTRSRSILLLLAAMCIVTSSRNISTRIQSDNTTCLLEMDGTDVLQELLEGDAAFINIKLLSFVDSSDFATQVVDINRWVMISGKIGELLVTFPFDFECLSLGTLSPSVEHIFLNVTSIPKCFFDVDSEDKLLNNVAKSILQRVNKGSVKQDVCIERKQRPHIFHCLYAILQSRTYFECWHISEDDSSVESHKFMKHFWFFSIFWISFIFTVLTFNWFFVSFLCRVKPMIENGKEYFSLRTDLPLGPKYLLLHSGNQQNYIFCFRWLILWTLFGSLQYVPSIICHVLVIEGSKHRFTTMFLILEISINLLYILLGLIMLITWLKYHHFIEAKIMENIENSSCSNLPQINYSGLHRLSFESKENFRLAVSSWKDIFANVKCVKCLPLKILVVPLLFIVYVLNVLKCTPLFHGYLLTWRLGHCYLFCYLIFYTVLISKLACIFVYICQILLYFYIGLLVNPSTAGVVVAMVVIVIGYVISIITSYYKGYVVLLQQVISAFDEFIKDNVVQISGDKLHSFPQFTNHELPDENDYEEEIELISASASNSTIVPNETPSNETFASAPNNITSLPVIRQDTEGLTAIEKTFFDLVVQKYRPTEIQFLTIILKVLILSLVIWVGFSALKTIADYDDLKQVKLYAAVAIAGILPLFEVILRNKAEEKSKKKIIEKCIRQDIEEYFKKRLSENWYEIMNSGSVDDGGGETGVGSQGSPRVL